MILQYGTYVRTTYVLESVQVWNDGRRIVVGHHGWLHACHRGGGWHARRSGPTTPIDWTIARFTTGIPIITHTYILDV